MNQVEIGEFLRELRKEKGLTQEQLSEQFNVSRRSVSRWETGSSIPDLDVLIEIADFYEIDLRDLIEGKRNSEKMDSEVKDTLIKAAEYSAVENGIKRKRMIKYFLIGGAFLVLAFLNDQFDFVSLIFKTPVDAFVERAFGSIGICFLLYGAFYNDGSYRRLW